MEALAALGVACNILQLIECGYKVIGLAKELHDSGQETIPSNSEATFVAREMRELSLKLTKDLPSSHLTDDEEALCRLAQQCIQLSNKLLVLLESLRVKNEPPQQQKAAEHSDQPYVSVIFSSDLVRKLEQTLSISSMSQQDILYLKDHVQTLQQKSTADSVGVAKFFRDLQRAVEVPLRQIAILQSIQYPRMYYRFDNVETAHRKTFEWLLHSTASCEDNRQLEDTAREDESRFSIVSGAATRDQARYQKHKEFVSWLQGEYSPPSANANSPGTAQKGNIFHIAGKPGAGKSTLMKYLCENQATSNYLKAWSGEKHLIKNRAGLINCLLYQLLKAAPALIPIAEWTSNDINPASFNYSGSEALDHLLGDNGLDEFKGSPFELIRKIIEWAAFNPADLKICVSSREWNEFEVGFKGYPNLRIQEWTRDDIGTFVTDRFDEIYDFSTSGNKQDLDPLAKAIIDKAEGVFLWVRVVLAAIEQGVLNCDDIYDLKRKVAAFPSELNDLYQHLFDSIPEYDRRKALEALIFTHYDSTAMPQTLLRYKFLGDLAKDPDFAVKLPTEPLPEEELNRSLEIASRQINGRCKGFLEVVPATRETHRGDESVQFMHSTVAEFLRQTHVRKSIKSYIGDINMFDRTCQSFIAFAKSIDTDEFYSPTSLTMDKLANIMRLFIQGPPPYVDLAYVPNSKERFVQFLDHVERLGNERLQKRLGSEPIILSHDILYKSGCFVIIRSKIIPDDIVKFLAAQHSLIEYFERYDLRTLLADSRYTKVIMFAAVSGVSYRLASPRTYRMLEVLFKAGISPNMIVTEPDGTIIDFLQCGLWRWMLIRLLLPGQVDEGRTWWWPQDHLHDDAFQYRLIELCLRYGAGEDFGLVFGPCYEVLGADRRVVQVNAYDSSGQSSLGNNPFICVDYDLDVVESARRKNGMLTFRDLLAYCFPNDHYHLYALLDKCSPAGVTGSAVESYDFHPVSMKALFPKKNLYRDVTNNDFEGGNVEFDDVQKPKNCKQCVAHSEKCFTDFEAKLGNKG
ncbi:hypothetical protein F4677DRAFT_458675 [Hypoxylon crocopeplum]|nr:hypothetical protein F4677DRAFT_458675 [Hypoxylon crocopeplum]